MPSSRPKFSIITCTWNSEPYLRQSIDSILSQDYQDYEYIFVDGGSTDGTLDIINSIKRPIVLAMGVGGGISVAMNEGIRIASGDIVAHLHSDDYYVSSTVLSEVAEVFSKTDAGWIFGEGMRDVRGIPETQPWDVPRYSYARLLKGNFIPHESTFVRRDLLVNAGMFSTRWKYGMDYDMWLKLGKVMDPVQLDTPLGVFREHANSYSTVNSGAAFEEDLRIRLSHVGISPAGWIYHYLYYLVRKWKRHRLVRITEARGV
jgi:glycosyltransferase involved in cell wall biosynthesis